MQKQKTFRIDPLLYKYFWDHTRNASDIFKLKRLLEYASFPDLLKIPFEILKSNIHHIKGKEKVPGQDVLFPASRAAGNKREKQK